MAVDNMFKKHNPIINIKLPARPNTGTHDITCSGCVEGYPVKHRGCSGDGYLHAEYVDSGDVEGYYTRIRCTGCDYRRDTWDTVSST